MGSIEPRRSRSSLRGVEAAVKRQKRLLPDRTESLEVTMALVP